MIEYADLNHAMLPQVIDATGLLDVRLSPDLGPAPATGRAVDDS
jgi:hypothetical protein